MDQYEEGMVRIDSLETGIIHVMLEQIEQGTIQHTAADIRRELPRLDSA